MIIQYTQRRMVMTVQRILSALYDAVAKFGCGLIGYDLEINYGRTTKSR
jgi:hypothetical protein